MPALIHRAAAVIGQKRGRVKILLPDRLPKAGGSAPCVLYNAAMQQGYAAIANGACAALRNNLTK